MSKKEAKVATIQDLNVMQQVQGKLHQSGLGINLEERTMKVIDFSSEGQCHQSGHVVTGDILVGVNDVALSKCMKDPGDVDEFQAFMNAIQRPLKLNFNDIVVPQKFLPKLVRGFQVQKKNRRNGKIDPEGRVMWSDKTGQTIMVGKMKVRGDQFISMHGIMCFTQPSPKIISVHEISAIHRVEEVAFEIVSKAGIEKHIVLICKSVANREYIVNNLHQHVSEKQAKMKTAIELEPLSDTKKSYSQVYSK